MRAPDPNSRRQAQQRANRIGVFREELAELELEQALTLTPEQRTRLEAHWARLLEGLAARFDVDISESGRRISWGMRIASLLGGAALWVALVLFLHRVWGDLVPVAQVLILSVIPLLLLAAAEFTYRRGTGLYYTALLALAAGVGFVMELSVLGSIFNMAPSAHALLAWGGFAVLIAYAYGLRLPLGAGLLLLCAYAASLLNAASGGFWADFLDRPESLLPAALLVYAIPSLAHRHDPNDFGFVYCVCGATVVFTAFLVLSIEDYASYAPYPPRPVETLYQVAGLVTSGAARDLDQVRRLRFPAFSSGVICSHGYSSIVSLHVPVRVGGLAVHPGDLLHADANGVTNIPLEIASEVAEAAAEFVAAEAVVLDFVKTGTRDVRRYAEARKECMDRIAALGRRLARR